MACVNIPSQYACKLNRFLSMLDIDEDNRLVIKYKPGIRIISEESEILIDGQEIKIKSKQNKPI